MTDNDNHDERIDLVLPYEIKPGESPEWADAVALLRANIGRDVAGVKAVVDGTDPILLGAVLVSVAIELGVLACGSVEALDATLADWQQRDDGQSG
jgi:hypothetical protein